MLGILALVLTLLYWLAEAMRIYDHDVGRRSRRSRPSSTTGPPPGVHMPGPSFRPFLGAIGMTILMFGLVFGGWLLLAGVVALILTLVRWLFDAIDEYRRTVEARPDRPPRERPDAARPEADVHGLIVLFVGGVAVPDRAPAAGRGERRRRRRRPGSPAPSGPRAVGRSAHPAPAPPARR